MAKRSREWNPLLWIALGLGGGLGAVLLSTRFGKGTPAPQTAPPNTAPRDSFMSANAPPQDSFQPPRIPPIGYGREGFGR